MPKIQEKTFDLQYIDEYYMSLRSSDLTQRVAINEIAESIMAFNTNYKDTGLFGVYAVAKVNPKFLSFHRIYDFLFMKDSIFVT